MSNASVWGEQPSLSAAAGTIGAQLLQEFSSTGSVLSKYVRPLPSQQTPEEQARAEAERMLRASGDMDGPARPQSSGGRRMGTTLLATGGRRSVAASAHSQAAASSTAMVPHASSTSQAASTAVIPRASSGPSYGPYHSPLQRQLATLYPEYTEAQLTLHSKFTPSFYLGPACHSLDDGRQDVEAKGGQAVRWDIWKEDKAQADQANYTIGTNPLTPSIPSIAPQYSQLKPLDADQRSLLQSAFDRIDEVYPLPGQAKKAHSVRDTIASINRSTQKRLTVEEQREKEAKRQQEELPQGMRRQLVPRMDGGVNASSSEAGAPAATYDVFHLPYGFKVVRDDTVDPRSWGGTVGATGAAGGPGDALHDAGVKERVRSVLDTLQDKYAPALFDKKHPIAPNELTQVQFQAQGPNSSRPASSRLDRAQSSSRRGQPELDRQASSASSAASGASATALQPKFDRPKSSTSRRATGDASLPSSSAAAPPNINRDANLRFFTPGPEIEDVSSASHDAYGRKLAEARLEDEREILPVDYDKERRRNARELSGRKKMSKSGPPREPMGIVVGKPLIGGKPGTAAANKVVRIPPSRGTQLLNKIAAQVRCCCLVPQTGAVWSVQRDAVLIIRERMTGKMTHKIDTPSLIWCMLLLDNGIMWLGTETGVILAYNVYTHVKLKQVTNHAGGIHCLVRGAGEGNIVFSGSNDFTMSAYTQGTMEVVQSYMGHAGGVRCVLPLSEGRVWSGGDDGAIRVWDAESGGTVEELVRHTGSVLSLITTGHHIWSAGEDGTICQWSISPSIQCLKQISTGSDRIQTLMLVGGHVWSCGQDPRIHVWNARTMDWLGALKGHARYLSAFCKVRIMETRIIWSFGLGEENILVWRAEAVCEDARDKLVALTAQLISQAEEIAHLRQRVALAEAAQRALEEARERERAAFAKQLEDLLLQLAQALAGRESLEKSLADALRQLAELSAQNARLRNELRLHLEKLRAGEEVIKNLMSTVETKEDHITRLQQDALRREDHWRSKLARLEREHEEMLRERGEGDQLVQALMKQLAEYKTRNGELERQALETAESLAYYQREKARLVGELASLQSSSDSAALAAKLRSEAAHEAMRKLEQSVLEMTVSATLREAEAAALRNELALVKAEWHREKGRREQAERELREREKAHAAASTDASAERARLTAALHAQARRIERLEREKADVTGRYQEVATTLDQVARELQVVERRVHTLSKPSAPIYSIPRPTAVTFQQVAARRDAYDPGDPIPPAQFFNELASSHGHISKIMYKCLNELQKLHVGYSPAQAQEVVREIHREDGKAIAHVSKSTPSRRMIQSSTSSYSSPTQEHKQQHSSLHESHPHRVCEPPSLASTGTFTVRDVVDEEEAENGGQGESGDEYDSQEEEDGAGPDQLATTEDGRSQEGSPVQNVWLNQPKTALLAGEAGASSQASTSPPSSMQSPTSASARSPSDLSAPKPPSTAPFAASTVIRSPTESKRSVAAPLLSYDLNSPALRPSAGAPSSPTFSTRPTVEAKRAADQQREARLMALEHQTQQRKVNIRRRQQ